MSTRVFKVWREDKYIFTTDSTALLLSYLRNLCLANGLHDSEIDMACVDGILQSDFMIALDCEVDTIYGTEE